MPYCYNCGSEIDVRDRKCDKCSYPVGHVITAQDDGIFTVKRRSNPYIRGIKEILQLVCEIAKSPVDNIMVASKNMRDSLSFGVLALLLMVNGALFIWSARLIEGTIKNVTEKTHKPGVMGATQADLGTLSSFVSFHYGKVFFNGVILFAIVAVLQFALLYLTSKFVFKAKVKAVSIWKISISVFIPYFLGAIAAFILNYFSIMIALVVFILSAAASAICLYKALEQEVNLSSNKVILIILASYGIMFIVITLVIKYKLAAMTTNFMTKELFKSLFLFYTMS